MRLINNVVGALIEDNTITDCGIHDYVFGGAKNGEGIYIGTSSSQVRRCEPFLSLSGVPRGLLFSSTILDTKWTP